MKLKKHKLDSIEILVADPDERITKVLADTLYSMGFGQVYEVRNGDAALGILSEHDIDLLITDWQMRPRDGMNLITYLRRSEFSPNRQLPIVMLTGRAEIVDVEMARDNGVTEFIVKPFTAKSVFKRIEQIIDHPRGFVISPSYVGPDRRRKMAPLNGRPERRKQAPKSLPLMPYTTNKSDIDPKLVVPDFRVKKKIGIQGNISSLITEEVLAAAQQTIDSLQSESLKWIHADMHILEQDYNKLATTPTNEQLELIKESILYVKSHTGTFGYNVASDIAQQLYSFLRSKYQLGNPLHNTIMQKHIQSMKVILANALAGGKSSFGQDLLTELGIMINKVAV